MPLTPGHRLGSYEIVSALGAGGMGEVYRARDSRLGRDVALKVLPADLVHEPGRLERFDREARAIAALNHPHIVTIHSTEEADGIRFLTMELVDGCTLGDLVVAGGIPIPKFLEIAVPLADALAAAHQKQITHRDLKPGNVMLSNDGRIKVLDFGLARVGGVDAGEQTLMATQAPITHHGMIVGTMPYMSPEQVEGRPLDPRSDLFSLGVIFYELLSGERPFNGSSSPALMSAILRDTPASITEKRADVPEALDRLLSRLIEKRPEDRVQTARDVFNELRHINTDSSTGVQRRFNDRSTVENLSVAVLPFTSRGAHADAEAMAAGLTDDITTSLAKFPGLSVVAAQSTRAFKDSPLDVREIAVRIGARYMVSGSVRQSAVAFRISTQLIDASTGTQLWSETYDRRLAADTDVFAIQDDVTDYIVATVADQSGVLAQSMVRSLHGTTIGESTNKQLLVWMWGAQHEPTPSRHAEIRDAVERQLESQPANSQLWAMAANLYVLEFSLYFNPRPDPLGRALRAARRAVELDRGNQDGWLWLGLTHCYLRDRAGVEEAFDRALRINPRNAHVMAWVGDSFIQMGDYERGGRLCERAMQINPAHPGWLHFSTFNRHFAVGRFEEALHAARRVNIPTFFWMHFTIAAACGHLGRIAEGRAAAEEMVRLNPLLADESALRDFVTRWYWDEAIIASLLEGVLRSFNGGSTDVLRKDVLRTVVPQSADRRTTVERPSNLPSNDPSIAVLPFTDLSEKKDQDWFCDGIAEEILNALAPLPGLRVAARASAFSLRGKADDLRSIGEKLQVTTVLGGSVRRAGDRVRITVQLSDAREGRQLWSERFDRELKDIFDVQEEIARAIVDRLKITITAGARLVTGSTNNMQAYELLLKGRVLVTRRGRSVAEAIPCFEQAIALDPNLSEAHALLGDAYRLLGLYGVLRTREASPKARAALERALAIDPNHPEALAGIAILEALFEWNEAEFIRLSDLALAADPSHVRALTERAMATTALHPESSPEWHQTVLGFVARAKALDPLNAWVAAIESIILSMIGRTNEAVDAGRRAIQLDENNLTAHWFYTSALAGAGREDEAMAAASRGLAMSGRNPFILTIVSAIHNARGAVDEAEAIRLELSQRAEAGYIGEAARAAAAAAAGKWEEARTLLRQAIDERDPYLTFWKLYAWRPIWADPECAAMIRATSLFSDAHRL